MKNIGKIESTLIDSGIKVIAGVDEAGALILRQQDQSITIHAGDLSLRVQS